MFNKFTKCKLLCDMFLVCLAMAPTIYLEGYRAPVKGVFSCSDVSIQHSFKGETYPCWSLLVIALPVPIVLILLMETLAKGSRYKALITYLFGLFTSVSLMEILKFTVGRPRPVFMEWCHPRTADLSGCGNSSNHNMFVADYWCENTNVFRTVQSTLSFPSGHASISVYALTYVALYLHFRMSSRVSLLFKHLLQVVCVTLAASISVSRVTDHMHFWSDVVAGMIIGISFALWIIFGVSDLAKARDHKGNWTNENSSEV